LVPAFLNFAAASFGRFSFADMLSLRDGIMTLYSNPASVASTDYFDRQVFEYQPVLAPAVL
jgi:hypothetical protein